MITIVNKYTGEVLCGTIAEEVVLNENETAITEVLTEVFIKPFFDFETRSFYEGEVLTEEQIILQSRQNQALQIKEKYEQHRLNGWNAYQDFRAMIVLDIYEGKITETQAFLIENDLKVAYDRISQNGDWKTAYYELSQKTVSHSFIQPYMDIAMNFILNYIQTNYES
jgi:hypothetical protein